jgi:hypothetical protein
MNSIKILAQPNANNDTQVEITIDDKKVVMFIHNVPTESIGITNSFLKNFLNAYIDGKRIEEEEKTINEIDESLINNPIS